MADIAVLDIKVENLLEKCEETHGIVKGLENEVSEISDRTYRIEIWKDGNGAKGAEMRLQEVEGILASVKSCIEKVSSDESIARIAQIAARGVVDNARTKDRTLINKAKAFAPYFAAVCALIAGSVAVAK